MNSLRDSLNFIRHIKALALIMVILTLSDASAWASQTAFGDPASRSPTGTGGDLTVVEGQIDAGSVALGSSSQVVVLLRNDSTKPIKTGTISLYPSSNVSASVGENECARQDLPPEAVCAISVAVKGLQAGSFRIEMLLRHDGRTKLITSTISGTVQRSEDDSTDIISDLETIPSELDFGSLEESRPLTRSLILRNVTSSPIDINSIDIESNDRAGYSQKSTCDKLLSGEACVVTVTWAPQQRGPATGVLVVNHDGPTGVVSVILNGVYEPGEASSVGVFPEAVPGKGLLTASRTEVDFGSGVGSASAITVSLVNIGDAPLKLNDIRISSEENGVQVVESGCRVGSVLDPVEACPLTLKWEPVREGSIIDDVQIRHSGARGILVLPVRGTATKAVNRDSQAFVFGDDFMSSVPSLSSGELGDGNATSTSSDAQPTKKRDVRGALEGFRITSIARDRAIVSGPGGSRVVFNGEETVIGGVLWKIGIKQSAVEFMNGNRRIMLLFDRSLSAPVVVDNPVNEAIEAAESEEGTSSGGGEGGGEAAQQTVTE